MAREKNTVTTVQEFAGLISASLATMYIFYYLAGKSAPYLPEKVVKLLPLAAPVLVLIPVAGQPLYYGIRGIIGDLSITTQVLVLALVIQRMFSLNIVDPGSYRLLRIIIPVAGLLLYPAALGLLPLDSYRTGFEGILLPVAVMLLTLWAWWRQHIFLASTLVMSVLLAGAQVMESANLWDYLIDPVIFILFSTQWIKEFRNSGNKNIRHPDHSG